MLGVSSRKRGEDSGRNWGGVREAAVAHFVREVVVVAHMIQLLRT